MFPFSRQEKIVLLGLAGIFILGSLVDSVWKRWPRLKDQVMILERRGRTPRVLVNSASVEELLTIPGIGLVTAREIVALRERGKCFSHPSDLLDVPRIGKKRLAQLMPFFSFSSCPP